MTRSEYCAYRTQACREHIKNGNSLLRRLSLLLARDCLDHVCVVAALSTRPRVYVLETFKFELCFGFGWRYLLLHGMVSVDLRIGHSNANRALALRALYR